MVGTKQESSNGPKLFAEDRVLSEETIIALTKLEHDYEMGRLGLRGTLMGACAGLCTIILIVFAPTITKKDIVEGWQLVTIVALVAGSVLFYGTFVFNRSLKISAQSAKHSVDVGSSPPCPRGKPSSTASAQSSTT